METPPPQPPEGKLIAEAQERSGLSIRQASERAGLSYGRWRQITSGYQNASAGSYARVIAPPRTLARMAAAVRVSPDQLEDSGREDAAGILRAEPDILSARDAAADESEAHIWATPGVTEEVRRGLIALLRGMRQDEERRTGT